MSVRSLRFQKSTFARYTTSARRAIFYAMHGARTREAPQIATSDLLLGLARDRHHEECGFRFLNLKHEELAASVGIVWPLLQPPWPRPDRKTLLPLSDGSKRVLAYAKAEADRAKQFWIDTDHLQAGLLLEGGRPAEALQSIGYNIESTRLAGAEGRARWPPARPTIMQRLAVYPASVKIVAALIAGFLIANFVSLLRAR